jgi:hypothetical protein
VEFVRELEPVEAPERFEWADANHDGILQPEEQRLIIDQYERIARGPHRVSGALDEMFDWDRNGRIDETETRRAVLMLFRDGLRQAYRWFPEFAWNFLDFEQDEHVSIQEADLAVETAFGGEVPVPRAVEGPLDERLDVDMDGWVIAPEIESYVFGVTRSVASIPEPPVTGPETPAGAEFIYHWTDANRNERIEPGEMADVGTIALRIVQGTEIVSNPLERYFDENDDFLLDEREREEARAQFLEFVPAVRREALLQLASNPEQILNRRPANDIQREMDTDPENNRLEEHEVYTYLDRQFAEIGAEWLRARVGEFLVDPDMVIAKDTQKPAETDTGEVVDDAGAADAADVTDGTATVATTTPAPAARVSPPRTQVDQVGDELSLGVTLRPIYPVLRKYYDTAPFGFVEITNTSENAVTDLEVTLSLDKYIDRERTYDEIESLAAGETKRVDLTLLFNSDVLEITQGDRVDATVTVSYTGAGGAAEETATETMIFYDRNAIRWDDTDKVAAFVTERDEEIRSYARRVIAGARDERNDAVDDAFQDAMVLFIAMVESDLMYFHDPASSYANASTNAVTIDYLQFPRQTLTDYGGDCDDLSVCYNALLESVGRRTAFVTVPGHIMPAVALTMTPSEARSAFVDATDLIFTEDTVWVPVEITYLEGSFYEAWQEGAQKYRQYSSSGQAAIHPTANAWAVYESVASVVDDDIEQPDRSAIASEFASSVQSFVTTQIASRELELLADLEDEPENARLLNRLGVLYARYGLWEKAETQFEAALAAERGIPALLNLGHISFLDSEYRDAVDYYEDALDIQSDHAGALLAAARANFEMENMGDVRDYYEKLRTASPRLAADYSYLDLNSSNETARAQAAEEMKSRVIWEEDEEEQ